MSPTVGTTSSLGPLLFASLLAACAATAAQAAEPSGCVTCHLDEAMLVKNLSATKARKSSLQSGAG